MSLIFVVAPFESKMSPSGSSMMLKHRIRLDKVVTDLEAFGHEVHCGSSEGLYHPEDVASGELGKYTERQLTFANGVLAIVDIDTSAYVENAVDEALKRGKKIVFAAASGIEIPGPYTDAQSAMKATSGEYDLVICDEINNSVHDGLLDKEKLKDLLTKRNPKTSVCVTGRNFPVDLIKYTDIATDMTKIKHHFDDKFLANEGIDY